MRIVSWNCNGALRNKLDKLLTLKADVYIIQECENPSDSKHAAYKHWAKNALWIGKSKHKGLGVFSECAHLSMLDWESNDLELFLPFTFNESQTILAVWACHGSSRAFRYIGQMWKYLQVHKEKLRERKAIILGDFNSNTCWDWKREHNHTAVLQELSDIGLTSAYHFHSKERQGEETRPTFFMQRNQYKPYHIDYAFASTSCIESSLIDIGKADEWLEFSDHMPMIMDIAVI